MTTNELTNNIIRILQLNRIYCWRNNNSGAMGRRGIIKKGVADIIGIMPNGIHIEIEIKNKETKDKMSQEQREHKENIINSKGIYIIANSVDDFIEIFNKELTKKKRV